MARAAAPGRWRGYYRANIGIIFKSDWPPAKVPVMGVWSDGDIFLSEEQMRGSEIFVDNLFRYERVDGANHWVQLSAPDKVNALLLDYLR